MTSATFNAARQRVNDPNGLLTLVEITHPSFTGPAHIVNDTRDWVSNGVTYVGLPFRFTMPQDRAKESPRAQLEIDNVGRAVQGELERLPQSAVVMCTVRLVDRSAPNTVEWQWSVPMTSITANAAVITATLGVDFLMRQQAVRLRHDRTLRPASSRTDMLASQIERYIGLPYDEAELDCADLAVLIQRDLFGKEISLPGRRQRMNAPAAAINRYSGELATRIERDELQDGDVIVFKDGTLHIGTVFFLSGKAWVLHTTMTGGYSLLQPLSDLPAYGLRIEGYYRWK